MCIMRNLSYHVHKEVPGADRYQESEPGPPGGTVGSQRRRREDAGCFGGKKVKGVWSGLGSAVGVLPPPGQRLSVPTFLPIIHTRWAIAPRPCLLCLLYGAPGGNLVLSLLAPGRFFKP